MKIHLALALAASLLAGCGTSPGPARSATGPAGSVLIQLDVSDPGAPRNLALSAGVELLNLQSGERFRHVVETPDPAVGSNRRTLHRLDVPAGPYSLVRVDARFGAASDKLPLTAELDAVFRVAPSQTAFAGALRFVVQSENGRSTQGGAYRLLVVDDPRVQFEHAKAEWIAAWPELQRAAVASVGFEGFNVLRTSLDPRDAAAAQTGQPPAHKLQALGAVTPTAAHQLSAAVRRAYQQFLQLPYPRAMALSPTGDIGMSAHKDGPIDRALRSCNGRPDRKVCVLIAVDDTLLADPGRVMQATAGAAQSAEPARR